LKDVVLADISIEDIENGWSEFSAVCDAVAAGRISAVLACERFGSRAQIETLLAHNDAFGIAEVYAFRGQPDEAMQWLDRAYVVVTR